MADLDDFAFLWDGSQQGWRLQKINHRTWHVWVMLSTEGPTVDEIRRVRQLDPSLGSLGAREAMARLRGATTVELPGPVGNIEMRALVERARALGLQTRVELEDRSSCLPMRNGEALLIELDDLARQVVERMEAAGLPVDLVEVD